MARYLSRAEAASQVMEHLIYHDASHGYSQPNRYGTGNVETFALTDGETVEVQAGDIDCSRAVQVSWGAIGILPLDIVFTTHNEREVLRECGFMRVSLDGVRRGDVLWKTGHTEMYLGNGLCGGARIDESGRIYGTLTGDQTGREIATGYYDPSRWEEAYRYFGPELEEPEEPEGGLDVGMECIISIKDKNTLVFFDGVGISDLTSTAGVNVLDKIHRVTSKAAGQDERGLPRVTLSAEEFARLCQDLRGGYPKHLRALVDKYAPRSPED